MQMSHLIPEGEAVDSMINDCRSSKRGLPLLVPFASRKGSRLSSDLKCDGLEDETLSGLIGDRWTLVSVAQWFHG